VLYDSPGTLVFRTPTVVGGRRPIPPKTVFKVNHPLSNTAISTNIRHTAYTVRASKNVQSALIESQPYAFQRAIDEPCMLPLSRTKVGTKHGFAV